MAVRISRTRNCRHHRINDGLPPTAQPAYDFVMTRQDKFDRAIASLHDATLDESRWRATSALIDDACGIMGNHLVIVGGDSEWLFDELYYRGEPCDEQRRDFIRNYLPHDERIPRIVRLPDRRVVHVTDLFTSRELKASPTYNEHLPRFNCDDGLFTRMDGPDGLHIVMALANPTEPDGWTSEQLAMIARVVPHVRQFVRVRQALAGAEALGASLAELLDNTMVGVVHLDRRGMIAEANARARAFLRRADGLESRGGFLRARLAADDVKLAKLLARVLPSSGAQGVSGSMTVERSSPGLPRLALHLCPVAAANAGFGVGRVAALVVIVDPCAQPVLDAEHVAATLGLTRAESRVAAELAAGATVRDIAATTFRRESSVRWLIKRIHAKLGVSRQADLVRMVLALTGGPAPRQ